MSSLGYADVLVGLQYGDEGKAKIVDALADGYDVIARFNGGSNAGHTIITGQGALKLRQIPSGILHPNVDLYIGSGCALNIVQLAQEILDLEKLGISMHGRLHISSLCPIVQPSHILFDKKQGQLIGTTGNGVGPCYSDRALRMQDGLRVSLQARDLLQDSNRTIKTIYARYASDLLNQDQDADQIADKDYSRQGMFNAWDIIKEFVVDDPLFLIKKVNVGARVLFEGAQSVLLDVTHGDQPFVTSSHTTPSYAFVGGDLPSRYHRKSIGVAKAIMSRVGSGPFPSELGGMQSARYCSDAAQRGRGMDFERATFDPVKLLDSGDAFNIGIALRMLTGEYGTGSGRPRRIGLLDVGQLADGIALHGIDELFLNKCDCLTFFSHTPEAVIPVISRSDAGKITRHFPSFSVQDQHFPAGLACFLQFIEQTTLCKIRGIGIGPERDHILFFDNSTTYSQ